MKKIETIIAPSHWEEARAQLEALGVIATLRDVRTFGRSPARREVYRGSAYVRDTMTEIELSMLVQDDLLEAALGALESATGDAEIIVTTVERIVIGRRAQATAARELRAAGTARPTAMPVILSSAHV